MSEMALLACRIEACMAYDDFSSFAYAPLTTHPSGRADASGVFFSRALISSQSFSVTGYSGHGKGYQDDEMLMGVDKQAGLVYSVTKPLQ